ncbi:hypothetical protein KUH32_07830 [Thalassococcus sp. CAU 1522]|uniref:Uncharacterized protein n=1 Tax=Thalassococcus arenae TaxID=2851652 RepID=A0ABS6N7W9_9RHOB|nr:hypothetical protein [Thalassococcus arenae]MBV2359679.1 hypothetical protein [Thalassococcus arenae]
MRLLVVGLALTLSGGPADALSCIRPDAARDFQQAVASEDIWIVVNGVLRVDETLLPRTDWQRQQDMPPQTDIPARLTGKSLGPGGFTRDFDRAVTLRALCFGPWCGAVADGTEYLAFLKREGTGYVMFADPCGGNSHREPTDDLRRTVAHCFQGKPCTPAERR